MCGDDRFPVLPSYLCLLTNRIMIQSLTSFVSVKMNVSKEKIQMRLNGWMMNSRAVVKLSNVCGQKQIEDGKRLGGQSACHASMRA